MGSFAPLYDSEETKELSQKAKEKLRAAILRELSTNKQIRKLLRKKTATLYKKLKPK